MSSVPASRWQVIRIVFRWLSVLVTTLVIATIMAFLAGVFRQKVPEIRTEPGAQVNSGSWTTVRLLKRPRFETATGTIRPVHETSLASRLLARVHEVNVKAGQQVQQGEVLVRLEDADLKSRLQQAEAAVVTVRSAVEQTAADFRRAQQLRPSNNISQAEFDQTQAAARTAASELTQRSEELREAQIVLGFATITAPITGTVVDKRVEVGDTVSPGQVLLTLYDPGRMQMVASVRESLALGLKVGQEVPAELESMRHECLATISEIVPEAQAASRSFNVKVTGPCPPGAYSGMFGRIKIPVGEEALVVIPQDAVIRIGQLTMVEVQENGHSERRSVQIGRTIAGDVEVLSGLEVGQQVLVRVNQSPTAVQGGGREFGGGRE